MKENENSKINDNEILENQKNDVPESTNNIEETNNVETTTDTDRSSDEDTREIPSKKELNKTTKRIMLFGSILALGIGSFICFNHSNNEIGEEFEDFTVETSNKTNLSFTIKDNGVERNRTAQEMREFYTPEGEEFIKMLYPDSSESDFALLTIGKSMSKELSNVELKTIDNKQLKLKDLKGKNIILDFALTTCPSCQEEFNYLSNKTLGKNDILIHIFPRNSSEEIEQIYKDLNLTIKKDTKVAESGLQNITIEDLNITHVPTKIYINKDGIVSYVTTATLSDEENYNLHYERAFGDTEKVLDFIKK